MERHVWSYPDRNGVKHCLKDGCAVRVRASYAYWQPRPRARWVDIIQDAIPTCLGKVP